MLRTHAARGAWAAGTPARGLCWQTVLGFWCSRSFNTVASEVSSGTQQGVRACALARPAARSLQRVTAA